MFDYAYFLMKMTPPKKTFLRLWDSSIPRESQYLQIKKTWKSSEPSQEWPAN